MLPIIVLFFLTIWGVWILTSLYFNSTSISPIMVIKRLHVQYQFKINKELCHNTLYNYSSYYKKLTGENQTKFCKRVKKFILHKEFIPIDIQTVTLEEKILLASSAVQLTFGLDDFLFHHFQVIKVYPSHFQNHSKTANHKGEVNLKGSISLSLDHFHEGYKNCIDGINLGLHEMAHALKFNQLLEQDEDNFFNAYYIKIEKESKLAFEKDTNLIREYGKTNLNEFFAVCVENFFERPELFKTEMPELYDHFVILLNQNPLNNILGPVNYRSVINDTDQGNETLPFNYSINYNTILITITFALFTIQIIELSILILLFGSFLAIIKSKKMILTDKGILTKKLLSSKEIFISFNSITYLRIDTNLFRSKIQIRHRKETEIIKTKSMCNMNSKKQDFFLDFLKTKKVAVFEDNVNIYKRKM
jgi:Mlc titration factor MtfA (ptsG expression regulator)